VTATASTTATLSGPAATGFADGSLFTLRGDNSIEADANSTAVTISAKIKGGDLSAVAQAINAQVGTTGISATIQTNGTTHNKEIKLTNASGADIQITNTNAAADDSLAAAGLRGPDQPPNFGSGRQVPNR
jgi:flagellin